LEARNTKDSQVILEHITQFINLFSDKNGYENPINIFRKGFHVEEKMNWRAYHHQAGTFLNHLDNKKHIRKNAAS